VHQLGRHAGTFQFAHRNDAATGFYLGGRAAARLKEFVCKGTVWQLAYESRKPGVRNWWAKDDKRRQLLAEQARASATAERAGL
jgi:hypothetical protein